MPFETVKALIWGKTYPELSGRHVETVCTGAVREDGKPIRLYPVPLRYLDSSRRYGLYDWIEVRAEKSTSDPRPESFKVVGDSVQVVGHAGTEGSWRERREYIFRDASWQFGSVAALKDAQRTTQRSLGIVTPGSVERVTVESRPSEEEAAFRAKWKEIEAQRDLFHPQYKELEYLPYRIKLAWRCLAPCDECGSEPHEMTVLDWGLLELARREHSPQKAADKLRAITSLGVHDFKIFMGSFRLRPYQFGVIGLWYPKLGEQLELL